MIVRKKRSQMHSFCGEDSWCPLVVASELTCSFRSANPGKPRPENKVWLSMVCARSHSWCRHPRNPAGIVHTYQHDRAKTCSDTEQLLRGGD